MTQRPYSLGNRRTIAVALFAFVFGAPGMFDDGAVWWGLVGNVPGGRVLPIVVAGMGAFGLVLIGIAWLRPPPKLRGLEITSGAILTTPPNIVPTAVIAGLRIVSRGPETVVLSLDMAIHDVGGKKVERMLPRDETRSTFSAPLNLVDGMDGKVAALWLSSDRQPPWTACICTSTSIRPALGRSSGFRGTTRQERSCRPI